MQQGRDRPFALSSQRSYNLAQTSTDRLELSDDIDSVLARSGTKEGLIASRRAGRPWWAVFWPGACDAEPVLHREPGA
jgi:hypothetical protein